MPLSIPLEAIYSSCWGLWFWDSATNEPKRKACGAPDYVITKNDIPVGFIEAKDVGVDLESKMLMEQFEQNKIK